MSRIGNRLIEVSGGATVDVTDRVITITGPKGELALDVKPGLRIVEEEEGIRVARDNDSRDLRSQHGLFRTLLMNMVEGVTDGYSKKLEIRGIGYRAAMSGGALRLDLGFSHPIFFVPPEEIDISVNSERQNTVITVEGVDKQVVGQVAAKIRDLRPPEPYKGKGIRYLGEQVRRKAGKAAVRA